MNKKKERKKRKDKQIHLISSFLCVCVYLHTTTVRVTQFSPARTAGGKNSV